jgi:hypothetical protein
MVHKALGIALIITCLFMAACMPESTFQLADDSRLPKWIQLPAGQSRSDIAVEMSYYVLPWGRKAVFSVQDKKPNQP